ncbi:MAG: hypothetical protein EHM24_31675 [Acidobacteria bacterium]|nr:MAG: hypothetical protein EHM24_31675 [Acidobacteriota bacterium]
MRVNRRRRTHAGVEPQVGEPTIDSEVGLPPLPLPSSVPMVSADGLPTVAYYQWQQATYEWRLLLFAWLGGTVDPREPRPAEPPPLLTRRDHG